MKNFTRLSILAFVLTLIAGPVFGSNDYFVFKTSGAFTVNQVIHTTGAAHDIFLKKLMTGNDIVNAALGRKLGTAIDAKTTVLAVSVSYSEQASDAKLIIYNPSLTGTAAVTAVIATIADVNLQSGYYGNGEKATAVATITLQANGDPTADPSAIIGGTLTGAAQGSEVLVPNPAKASFSLRITGGAGTIQAKVTDSKNVVTMIDGIVTKGMFNASGKYIATYTE